MSFTWKLGRSTRPAASRLQAAQRKRRRALLVESLEERRVLATWYVDVANAGAEDGSSTNPYNTITEGIAAASDGDTVVVAAGTYAENVVLDKQLTLQGAKVGVDARGRVVGAPNAAVETVVAPASGNALKLQGLADNATIDGFSFVAVGAVGVTNDGSGNDNLVFKNNFVTSSNTTTLFLDSSAPNATMDKNEFLSQPGSAQAVQLDGADDFDGLQFTNNNLLRSGAAGGTGLVVDGNHNVGTGVNPPLIKGNLFQGLATGANLGRFSFDGGEISENTFTSNSFDGLQGGIQNSLIRRNTFSSNGRNGLSLTPILADPTDSTKGAFGNTVTENTFSANAQGDLALSDAQFPGTISTNIISNNSLGSATTIVYRGEETINASGNWLGSNVESTVLSSVQNPTNERQWLGIKSGVTGTMVISYNGNPTSAITVNPAPSVASSLPSAATLQAALEGLPGIGAGNVAVSISGGSLDIYRRFYIIEFQGALANTNVSALVVDPSGLSGGTVPRATMATLTNGAHGPAVDITPYLDVGTDTNVGQAGFQGSYSVLHVTDGGAQSGATARVQEAVNAVTGPTSTVVVESGTYTGAVNVNLGSLTSFTLTGRSGTASDSVINSGGSDGVTVTAPATVTVQDLRITGAAQGVNVSGLTALTLSNLLIDGSTGGGTIGTTPTVTFAGSPGNDSIGASATQLSNTGVQAISHSGISTLSLNGLAGNDTITVQLGGSLPATVNSDGGTHTTFDTLQVTGTSGNDSLTVSGTTVTDGSTTISLSNLEKLTLNLSGNGTDAVQVNLPVTQPSVSMQVNGGGSGSDTLTVDTGAGAATIGIDSDSVDVTGQPSIGYTALNDLYVNSGNNADTYTVAPSPTTTMHLDANLPTGAPGDILNYQGPPGAPTTIYASYIQSTGYAAVNYVDFETINLGGDLVVSGSGLNDVLDLTATSVTGGSYVLTTDGTPGPVIGLSGVTKFTFDALAGDDQLIVHNPSGSLFAPTNGIKFYGGSNNDALEVLGGGSASGSSGSYVVGPTADQGTLIQTTGAGTQNIQFTGLEPVSTTTTLAAFSITVTSSVDTINVVDGPMVNSVQTVEVNFNGAFELIRFANKTTASVNAGDGADVINVNYTTAPAGVTTLNLNGENDADTYTLLAATPSSLTTNLTGGSGPDVFDVDFTLTGAVSGGGGSDELKGAVIDDVVLSASNSNGFNGTEPSVTGGFTGIDVATGNGGTLTGISVPSIWGLDGSPTYYNGTHTLDFSGFANLQGGSAVDTFNVIASSTFNLKGGGGNDSFVMTDGAVLTGTIDGNGGSDTLDYSGYSSSSAVCVDLTAGPPGSATNVTGGILAGSGGDIGASVENLLGGDGADTLIGDIDVNQIRGNDGNDLINAKGGFDDVDAGDDDDIIQVEGTEAEFDLMQGGPNGVDSTGDYDTVVNIGGTAVTLNGFNLLFDLFANSIDEYQGNGQSIQGSASGTVGPLGAVTGDNELHFGFTKFVSVVGLNSGDANDDVTTSFSNDLAGASAVAYDGSTGTDHVTLVLTPSQFGNLTTAEIFTVQDYLLSPTGKTLTVTSSVGNGHFTATNFESANIAVYDDQLIIDVTTCFLEVASELQILVGNDVDGPGDTLTGTSLADLIFGQRGDDLISGVDGSDCLFGGAGADDIYGGNLDDLISGGSGNDEVFGGADEDLIYGGLGNDTLNGEDGQDTVRGNSGNDVIDGGNDEDLLNGDVGDDVVVGGAASDVIQIYGNEATNDTIDGGGAIDILEIIAAGGTATLVGFSNGSAGGGYLTENVSNIEQIQGNGQGLIGTSGNNWFDVLGVLTVNLAFIDGSSGNDYLSGTDFNDVLLGGPGNDSLIGNSGDDVLTGGANDDALIGGLGSDVMDGDGAGLTAGIDSISGGDGYDTIKVRGNQAVGDTMNGGNNTDTIVNDAASPVTLNTFNASTNSIETWLGNGQPIVGTSGADNLNFMVSSPAYSMTLSGVTYINGLGGNDTISGTNGNDVIYGGDGDDTLSGFGGTDYIYGGDIAVIVYTTDADVINGGDGADYLYGGFGSDTITGGAGKDYFIFQVDDNATDIITDLSQLLDRVDLSALAPVSSLTFSLFAGTTSYDVTSGSGTRKIRFTNRTTTLPSYVFKLT